MTDRVHGGVESGQWFSAEDIRYISFAHAGFVDADEGVANSTLEEAYELLAAFGNPVIMQVEDGTALHVAMSYAAGDAAGDAALQSAMNTLLGSTVTITEGEFRVGPTT